MTSLRSSTLLLAAFAPAPVSSDAVSRPLITRVSTPTLKNEMNFSCASISLRAEVGRLHPPCRAQDTIAIESSADRRRGTASKLPVWSSARTSGHGACRPGGDRYATQPASFTICLSTPASLRSSILFRPFLKVEQIAKELERFGLAQKLATLSCCQDGFEEWSRSSLGPQASVMCLRHFPAASAQTPFSFDGSSVRHQCRSIRRKPAVFSRNVRRFTGEYLRGGIRVLRLTRKVETRHHARVLIEARTLR